MSWQLLRVLCFSPQRFVGFDIPAGGARKLNPPPEEEEEEEDGGVDGQEISSICKLKGELVLSPSTKALAAAAAAAAFDARLFATLPR